MLYKYAMKTASFIATMRRCKSWLEPINPRKDREVKSMALEKE